MATDDKLKQPGFLSLLGFTLPVDDQELRLRLEPFLNPCRDDLPDFKQLMQIRAEPGLPWLPVERRVLEWQLAAIAENAAFEVEAAELRRLYGSDSLLPLAKPRLFLRDDDRLGDSGSFWCLESKRLFLSRSALLLFAEDVASALISRAVVALAGVRTTRIEGQLAINAGDFRRANERAKLRVREFWPFWRRKLESLQVPAEMIGQIKSVFIPAA